MVLKHRTVNDIDVVDLAGRLVMGDAPEVREQLKRIIAKGHGKLVLNLAEVSFMDSSGLSVLVSAFKAVQVRRGGMVLLAPTPKVQSLIELTRLQQIFEIFDDEKAAVESLC